MTKLNWLKFGKTMRTEVNGYSVAVKPGKTGFDIWVDGRPVMNFPTQREAMAEVQKQLA